MDRAAVRVDAESDAKADDLVEAGAPRVDVEKGRDELAPRCEPSPIQVGDPETPAVVRLRELGDERERVLGPCEVGRIDDEAVGDGDEVVESLRVLRRRPGP